MATLNTKNKNEVLYAQKLINVLYKSPIVQKEKGKTFSLHEDGLWGPKTAQAIQFTFGKIPALQEMAALQNSYADLAKKAVQAQSGSLFSKATLSQAVTAFFNPMAAVTIAASTAAAKVAEEVKKGNPSLLQGDNLEKKILEAANAAAAKAVADKMKEQQTSTGFNSNGYTQLPDVRVTAPLKDNSSKLMLIGLASLAIILILK